MMDEEDFEIKSQPLQNLIQEDISAFGVEELEERIKTLETEIKRTNEAINARQGSRLAAEALFGKS